MRRLFTNGLSKDYVVNPFVSALTGSSSAFLAAPYFTLSKQIVEAAVGGTIIQLLIGLNSATDPAAVKAVLDAPNIAVRYLTRRFHAKIYVFDQIAIVGSSNLTDGGLFSNREAAILLHQVDDPDVVDEVRSLFAELWEAADVLTPKIYATFDLTWRGNKQVGPDPDIEIENAIGKVEPPNINVGSQSHSSQRLFIQGLRRQVFEQYGPAFDEVQTTLQQNGLQRGELASLGEASATNRFLNWVRLTHVQGDAAWQAAQPKAQEIRRADILRLGGEWIASKDPRIPPNYIEWVGIVRKSFATSEAILSLSKEELVAGLMCTHAFLEQLRFVKGGEKKLPEAFWQANQNDLGKVKETLDYLLHGTGDFIERLHDTLYDQSRKIAYFGMFCALELMGTVNPEHCPPINGRMAKALRYLGYEVPA